MGAYLSYGLECAIRHWRRIAAIGIFFGIGTFLFLIEASYTDAFYSAAITTVISSILLLIWPRPLFVASVAALFTANIEIISSVKQYFMDMGLHAYDLFFYANKQTMSFLWAEYPSLFVYFFIAIAISVVVSVAAYRADTMRLSRLWPAIVLVLASLPVPSLARTASKEKIFHHFREVPPISTFYLSVNETFSTLRRGRLIGALHQPGLENFTPAESCGADPKSLPNIILIHQESLMPPSLFPGLDYDKKLDPFFLSGDGELHKLHVEIYGGGSWLTDISILGGFSTRYSGNMRYYLQSFLNEGMRDTVPKILSLCGYRNLIFYTTPARFLGLGRFYLAAGYDEFWGSERQHPPTSRERDRFYYGNGLNTLQEHFSSSSGPIFLHFQTTASHSPYNFKFDPQEDVSGGGPGTPPEMSEFLRREMMAKLDYDDLVAELKRRFPGKKFLVVRYGDHQPAITRYLLNVPPLPISERKTPLAFLTFYSVSGLNYAVPPLPKFDALDISYLGTVMLESAGIPLPPAYRERKRLMELCEGKFSTCQRSDEILAFQQRLIQSGFMKGLEPEISLRVANPLKTAPAQNSSVKTQE